MNFNLVILDYSNSKRGSMTSSHQIYLLKHSGCGSFINSVDIQGGSRIRYSFKAGKQNREFSLSNGGIVRSMYTIDGNKLIYVQHGKKTITIVREFSLNHLIATITVDKMVARKYYTGQNRGMFRIGF